jgi:hypothetical protein
MASEFFCDTLEEAVEEVKRRKAAPGGADMIHKIERSPYRGYRVWSLSAEVYAEMLAEGIDFPRSQKRPAEFPG